MDRETRLEIIRGAYAKQIMAAAGLVGWVVNVWGVGYKLRPAAT